MLKISKIEGCKKEGRGERVMSADTGMVVWGDKMIEE